MPLIQSNYTPPHLFKNSHFSTIYPNLTRKIKNIHQKRERVTLNDGDFIDIDWSYTPNQNSNNLVILIHGLEGNAQRQYILGLARHLNNSNCNVAAINLRNCSGQANRYYKSYHAGASDDLDEIIQHITTNYSYSSITLTGFSLGGNLMLKYLGEERTIPKKIKAAVGISVPCDLYNSLSAINQPHNYIYQKRFIINLKAKLYERQKLFPNQLSIQAIKSCKSLMDIDNLYTSKAHGFADALTYYKKCSSLQFLQNIKTPTLIINAKNDTFLGTSCYPVTNAKNNPNLFLEIPNYGGHVGFYYPGDMYYHEGRVVQFLLEYSNL